MAHDRSTDAQIVEPRPDTTAAPLDVSVVVPFHNAECYIGECVRALLAQRFPTERYEIIMVDNNSTDRSAAIVRRYPAVTLLQESKQGAYAARNRGAAAARGAILAFTDADCVADEGWLETIVASMRRPEIQVVQGGRTYGAETAQLTMLAAYESERIAYLFSGKSRKIPYGYTNNMAVRRECFSQMGGFLEFRRGADSLFVQDVIERSSLGAVRYLPGARIRHLELRRVRTWLAKKFIYGRSFQLQYARRKHVHVDLSPAEGTELIKRTGRRNGYSPVRTIWLFALIWVGGISFRLGRLSVIAGSFVRSPT